jgi:SAM-dependent methyltransferase
MPLLDRHDEETLAFYEREAAAYAARREPRGDPRMDAFIAALAPGAAVLDLGCGGGQDAEVMLVAGLRVTAMDGSPALAAEASRRLGRAVQVRKFEELRDEARYDAVWANASLLHVPIDGLPEVLARVWRALKPGGRLFASFKAGDGPGRDALGRYYNFPSAAQLQAIFPRAAPWHEVTIEETLGGGYDGVERTWLLCRARRAEFTIRRSLREGETEGGLCCT